MLKYCGNCERRQESVPDGTAESIAASRYAAVSRMCLQVCGDSVKENIIGVNFRDAVLGDEDQTGTIVTVEKGQPAGITEIYKPVRLTLDFSD
jgi:hypothetical protein